MMFKPRFKTSEEVMKGIHDSFQAMLIEQEGRMADLDNKNDNDEITRLHYTQEIVNKWLNNRGYL